MKNLKFDRDANNDFIFVSPKDMRVKFAKTRYAFFMPFAEDIKAKLPKQRRFFGLGAVFL